LLRSLCERFDLTPSDDPHGLKVSSKSEGEEQNDDLRFLGGAAGAMAALKARKGRVTPSLRRANVTTNNDKKVALSNGQYGHFVLRAKV
jgi:hypothetical protein